jgi:hypothetical protein
MLILIARILPTLPATRKLPHAWSVCQTLNVNLTTQANSATSLKTNVSNALIMKSAETGPYAAWEFVCPAITTKSVLMERYAVMGIAQALVALAQT